MKLLPLEPRRVRRPLRAYGWTDLRAITQGHLEKVGTSAALTYLFLCSVGDTAGLSFWSRSRMAHILGLDVETIEKALSALVEADLIAQQGQIVQVLPIPEPPPPVVTSTVPSSQDTHNSSTQESAHSSAAAVNQPPIDSALPAILDDTEIDPYLSKARSQIERLLGRKECPVSRVQALARSLAIKAREGRRG